MRETDPKDPWSYLVPLTTKELAEERARAIASMRDAGYVDVADEVERGDGFTCDGCSEAPTCTLAYDEYNIDGDCLMDK